MTLAVFLSIRHFFAIQNRTRLSPVSQILRRQLLLLGLMILAPGLVFAQVTGGVGISQVSETATIYNDSMKAFGAGAWQSAAEGLEKVITLVQDPKEQTKLGQVHYTLGAAWFNAGDYAKAIAALHTFLEKFPSDPRLGDAKVAIARATFLNKDFAGAVKLFADLESMPAQRETALAAEAECYRELGKPDGQMKALEKLIAPAIKTSEQTNGAVSLAQLYLEKNQMGKALDLVNALFARINLIDNVVALNGLTVKLGDSLAESKNFEQAIAAYRIVRSSEEVKAFQQQRIAVLDKQMQANLNAARGNQQALASAVLTNNVVRGKREQAAQLLVEFEKLPDYMPGIYFRMGKAWYDWDKKWESIVVFDQFKKLYPEAAEKEPALFATLICYAELGRTARTQALCEAYLKDFPKGPNSSMVGYLLGAVSLQANDPAKAASHFGEMLDEQPNSEFREKLRLGLGNAQFMMGKFAEARTNYQRCLTEFPKGELAEEAQYRQALATLYLGEYEEAQKQLNAYLAAFPDGAFESDAGYRIMVCKYAASKYDEVVSDAKQWHAKHPDHQIAGEVSSLTGDAWAAQDKHAEAVEAYTLAYKKSTSDEVLNYALFAANTQLQKLGKWAEIAQMFEEFVRSKPDHPTVVSAMFWIGKSKAHIGKTEEAKTFLVEQLKRYLNEPKRDAVEQLLQQLAQLCAKRPRPAVPVPANEVPKAIAVANTSPTPAPTPPPLPPYDPVAELKTQMAPLDSIANATGRARLLYAEAELAKLRKDDAETQRIYSEIADKFKVEYLSPVLLAVAGDNLLARGEPERAAACYTQLEEKFPNSTYLDFAYVGLGELAMQKKDFPKALELFSHAVDDIAASKIKDATLGEGRALLELGRYEEARKQFEQVAGVREWRGESTASAVFYLGECQARQGKWADAIAHYQRVFVAYQKFVPWAAKAYLRSAEAFDKLGKRTEAVAHLNEMLRNDKMKDRPEAAEAKTLLAKWGSPA